MSLKLNYLPISFSETQFSGSVLEFDRSESLVTELRALRGQHQETHYFHRRGRSIFCVPISDVDIQLGTPHVFDTDKDFQLANALARNALLRFFVAEGKTISGLRPASFVLTEHSLLPGDATIVSAHPEYSFDVRPIAPHDGAFVSGVLIDFRTRRMINLTAAELVDKGVNLEGLYLQADMEDDVPYVDRRFRRQLIGRVQSVSGDVAHLSDAQADSVVLTDAYLEPSGHNFEFVGQCLGLGGNKGFWKTFRDATYLVSGAENQLERIGKIGTWFEKRGSLSCSRDLHVDVLPKLFECLPGSDAGTRRSFQSPNCVLRPGGTLSVPWPVDQKIDEHGPYDAELFPDKRVTISVVCPREFVGEVEAFLAQLKDGMTSGGNANRFRKGFVRKYHLTSCDFAVTPINSSSPEAYRKAVLETIDQNPHLGMVVIRERDRALVGSANPYFVGKAAFMGQGIPVQALKIETVRNAAHAFTFNNIALAMYAKLGGVPWVLESAPGLVHEIIVGIGSARVQEQRLSGADRLIGITTVFSGDGNYLLANRTREVTFDQYTAELTSTLQETIDGLSSRYGWKEGDRVRLIFHQSFKKYKDLEAAAVKQFIEGLKGFEVEYAFVHLSTTHNWKLFDTSSDGFKGKGKNVPTRGIYVPLGPHAGLLTLTGPPQLKTPLQGCPSPLLVSIHPDSPFQSLDYIVYQVYKLTFMSWRNFSPSTIPVSLSYSNRIVDLLGHLRNIPNWNPDTLTTKLRESRWFL